MIKPISKFLNNSSSDSDGEPDCDIMEKEISDFGGQIKLLTMELIVPPHAVKENKKFIIKKINLDLKFGLSIIKFSPIFELQPHSLEFEVPVILRFKIKDKNLMGENLCLYKQAFEKNDEILNQWTIFLPNKHENNFVEFKMTNLSFAFLSKLDVGVDVKCDEILYKNFNEKFQPYNFIFPGLNYRIVCENKRCHSKKELLIIRQEGEKTFCPNNDVASNEDTKQLICPICNKPIEFIKSIKSIMLFQAEGSIDFRLDTERFAGAKQQKKPFKVHGCNILIFGDETATSKYESMTINVNKIFNKNQVGAVSLDTARNIRYYKDFSKGYVADKIDPSLYEAVNCATNFDVSQNLDCVLLNTEKISNILKIIPDNSNIIVSLKFLSMPVQHNVPEVLLSLDSISRNDRESFVLYRQTDDEDDRILNKWTIHFPKKIENNLVEFNMKPKTTATVFFGKFMGIYPKEKKIFPGLSYIITCEDLNCRGFNELMIIYQGFAKFRINEDVFLNDVTNRLKCLFCGKLINEITSIKAVLLFDSKVSIDYKLNAHGTKHKNKSFRVRGNNYIVLIVSQKFSLFIIEVDKKPNI